MSSSRSAILAIAWAALAVSASAQDYPADKAGQDVETYGPVTDPPPPLGQCADAAADEDTIVVCRDIIDPDKVMSVIKPPVDGDAGLPRAPDLIDPPCWVTGGKALCVRVGHVPEYPPLVDLTIYPEPLSDEDAALVRSMPEGEAGEARQSALPQIGKRVPIELED